MNKLFGIETTGVKVEKVETNFQKGDQTQINAEVVNITNETSDQVKAAATKPSKLEIDNQHCSECQRRSQRFNPFQHDTDNDESDSVPVLRILKSYAETSVVSGMEKEFIEEMKHRVLIDGDGGMFDSFSGMSLFNLFIRLDILGDPVLNRYLNKRFP